MQKATTLLDCIQPLLQKSSLRIQHHSIPYRPSWFPVFLGEKTFTVSVLEEPQLFCQCLHQHWDRFLVYWLWGLFFFSVVSWCFGVFFGWVFCVLVFFLLIGFVWGFPVKTKLTLKIVSLHWESSCDRTGTGISISLPKLLSISSACCKWNFRCT